MNLSNWAWASISAYITSTECNSQRFSYVGGAMTVQERKCQFSQLLFWTRPFLFATVILFWYWKIVEQIYQSKPLKREKVTQVPVYTSKTTDIAVGDAFCAWTQKLSKQKLGQKNSRRKVLPTKFCVTKWQMIRLFFICTFFQDVFFPILTIFLTVLSSTSATCDAKFFW